MWVRGALTLGTSIVRVLEERYALTGASFIKFADALLPGVDGYYIGSGGDM